MKNNFKKYLIICITIFTIFFIMTNNKLINENILYAINLWITKIFPSLFPMFVINEILISSGFPTIIINIINNLNNRIKINTYAIYVFIMSIFSGTPSNAIILKRLVEKKEISNTDASYILSFSFFSNPIFLWTILSPTFVKSTTLKIILIHYLANIIIFFIFKKKINTTNKLFIKNKNNYNLSNILNASIKKSLDTSIMILGTITFYILVSTVLLNSFNFNDTLATIIKGALEITQGLSNLSLINSELTKEIIAISIISFGGLSIHSQIINIIEDTNISYRPFFIGRLFHITISIILIIVFYF